MTPVRAAEAPESPPPMWMCPIPHGATLAESTYLASGPCPRCGVTMARITDALARAALDDARAADAKVRRRL